MQQLLLLITVFFESQAPAILLFRPSRNEKTGRTTSKDPPPPCVYSALIALAWQEPQLYQAKGWTAVQGTPLFAPFLFGPAASKCADVNCKHCVIMLKFGGVAWLAFTFCIDVL